MLFTYIEVIVHIKNIKKSSTILNSGQLFCLHQSPPFNTTIDGLLTLVVCIRATLI